MEVSPEARVWLSDTGYDPTYGARPLNRVIKQHIMNPLAMKILEGYYPPKTTVVVEKDENGGLKLTKKD